MKWSSAGTGKAPPPPTSRHPGTAAGTIGSGPPTVVTDAAAAAAAAAMTALSERDALHGRSKAVCLLLGATTICVAISASDIFIQAAELREGVTIINVKNFLVVAAAYTLFAVAAAIFSFSRIVTVRSALSDIPKLYVPINRDDLPKRVYQIIQAGLTRVSIIAYEAQPVAEDIEQPGWGRPGSELENVNFRAQIIAAQEIIEEATIRHLDEFTRPHQWSVSRYISFLVETGLIDRRLGRHYVERYEAARFSNAAVSQQEFADFMKLQYLVLNGLDFYKEESSANDNDASVSVTSSDGNMLLGNDTDGGNEADGDSDDHAIDSSAEVL